MLLSCLLATLLTGCFLFTFERPPRVQAIALGDLNGDGLVAGVESYQVWRGEGNGRFTADVRSYYR